MLTQLIESLVHDCKYDNNLKQALKYNKTPASILSDFQACVVPRARRRGSLLRSCCCCCCCCVRRLFMGASACFERWCV
eukprot:15017230-Alexandrium_andersonii.AAC.1